MSRYTKNLTIKQPKKGNSADICQMPKQSGYGDGSLQTRYYYNSVTRRCHRFIYYGQGGNANNFRSLHECRAVCAFNHPTPEGLVCLLLVSTLELVATMKFTVF